MIGHVFLAQFFSPSCYDTDTVFDVCVRINTINLSATVLCGRHHVLNELLRSFASIENGQSRDPFLYGIVAFEIGSPPSLGLFWIKPPLDQNLDETRVPRPLFETMFGTEQPLGHRDEVYVPHGPQAPAHQSRESHGGGFECIHQLKCHLPLRSAGELEYAPPTSCCATANGLHVLAPDPAEPELG